jgi:DNA helicase HerA-like ATPase
MPKKMRHSKFRNTGILFELLTRQITADIIAGKDDSAARDLLFKYFRENTDLGKEWRLYNFLLTERMRVSIIEAEEEIHTFISRGKGRKMLATITMLTEMARQGRKRGLSMGIVSQQPALVPIPL